MGHTYADITIYGRDSTRSKSIRLLVDTGSTYTWVGSKLLRELAIQPLKEREFRTVEGRKPRRRVGEALIEAFGERATTIVVFAEKNDARVLGVHALEGLGLQLDPTANKLKKVRPVLAVCVLRAHPLPPHGSFDLLTLRLERKHLTFEGAWAQLLRPF